MFRMTASICISGTSHAVLIVCLLIIDTCPVLVRSIRDVGVEEAAGTINKTVLQFIKEGAGDALWWEDRSNQSAGC